MPALRVGEHPQICVTTTPRPTPLIRDLAGRTDGTVHLTVGATWENAQNLSAAALDELRRRYEGTRLGRQELEGELIADVEGALWQREQIDADRLRKDDIPELTRIVVAIDPATTSSARSDETGIIVAGEGPGGHGYVLADYSMRGTPDACMRKAVWAYHHHQADRVIAESNAGGDYLEGLLRTVDATVPYKKVFASRGKAIRAEPVSALYEQHRVHHAGVFAELEDELCTWTPADPASPNRLDATVWAFTELKLSTGSLAEIWGLVRCPSETCPRGMFYGRDEGGRARTSCPHCGTRLPEGSGEDQDEPEASGEPPAQQEPAPQPAWPMPPQLAGLAAYGARPPSPAQPARLENPRGGSYRQIGSIRVWD